MGRSSTRLDRSTSSMSARVEADEVAQLEIRDAPLVHEPPNESLRDSKSSGQGGDVEERLSGVLASHVRHVQHPDAVAEFSVTSWTDFDRVPQASTLSSRLTSECHLTRSLTGYLIDPAQRGGADGQVDSPANQGLGQRSGSTHRFESARTPVGSAKSDATRCVRRNSSVTGGVLEAPSTWRARSHRRLEERPAVLRSARGARPRCTSTAARLRSDGVGRVAATALVVGVPSHRPHMALRRTRAAPSDSAAASRPSRPAGAPERSATCNASLIERRSSKRMSGCTEHHRGVRNRRVSLQSPS